MTEGIYSCRLRVDDGSLITASVVWQLTGAARVLSVFRSRGSIGSRDGVDLQLVCGMEVAAAARGLLGLASLLLWERERLEFPRLFRAKLYIHTLIFFFSRANFAS